VHIACWNAIRRIGIAFPLKNHQPWGQISREQMILDLQQLRKFRESYLRTGEACIATDVLRRYLSSSDAFQAT
jgi:hypothetical protein